jgi:hypothetical protein
LKDSAAPALAELIIQFKAAKGALLALIAAPQIADASSKDK